MPKKKLTKAQVKRKINTIWKATYDLMLDKIGHGADSFIPISRPKLTSMLDDVNRARLKLK